MNNEELTLKRCSGKEQIFRMKFDSLYNDFVHYVSSNRKNEEKRKLIELGLYILHNWDYAKSLEYGDLYRVINVIKLIKSELVKEYDYVNIGDSNYLHVKLWGYYSRVLYPNIEEDGITTLMNGVMYDCIKTTFNFEEFNELEENYKRGLKK